MSNDSDDEQIFTMDDNTFVIEDNTDTIGDNKIDIWIETRGRKCDTYVHKWSLDENTLKEHLKNIKKKKGCNGSIKELIKDTGKIKVLHIQGNHKEFIIDYIIKQGVNSNMINDKL
jgi:translation initiation factor 1 (eIF-1/SUI1)